MDRLRFTRRAIELFTIAQSIAKENDWHGIHPVHLLIAAFKMPYDVNQELQGSMSISPLDLCAQLNLARDRFIEMGPFSLNLSDEDSFQILSLTEQVILDAKQMATLYEEHGQIFISDGQILKAVLKADDETIKHCLSEIDKGRAVEIIGSPRDMVASLEKDFEITCMAGVSIRKASKSDQQMVSEFVLTYFYDRWANTINYGLSLEDIPIYIAFIDQQIVGFAGYNISKQRKGYFGPLGVLKAHRDKKIGQALVNACLQDLKAQGYKNCVIGNASTFDFYEKACGARVILQQELDETFIRRANELAELAKEKGEDPFGAVLVRNNQIIHECHDGCIAYCDPTMHAERRLISEYCSENKVISLEDCTLYSSAEPCAMCSGAIHWAKIPRIVFGIPQEMLNKKSGGVKKMSCADILNQGKQQKQVVGSILLEESYKVIENHTFILKKYRIENAQTK